LVATHEFLKTVAATAYGATDECGIGECGDAIQRGGS
jgi:hypothetical protein